MPGSTSFLNFGATGILPPFRRILVLTPPPLTFSLSTSGSSSRIDLFLVPDLSARPNESGQSNMSPDHAVQLWWQYIEPQKANGHKLVAPAVSSSPAGFTWTQEFFAKCVGCTVRRSMRVATSPHLCHVD